MTMIVGLTGSIGMGKSTTANMFAAKGIPVWDADAAVREIYGKNGAAVGPLKSLDKDLIVDGSVSKLALKDKIDADPTFLKILESIVHPLVADHRRQFIKRNNAPIILLDIPLLFENGMEADLDRIICVTTDEITQRKRVLDRGTMTEDQFNFILSK